MAGTDWFHNLTERLQKGKPIQAPAAPPPQSNFTPAPYQLYVPYASEEFARTFLHLLKLYPEIPQHVRDMIAVWLEEYDSRIFSWLKQNYGEGVGAVADSITKQVMDVQRKSAEQQRDAAVNDAIDDLERRLNDDEG